MDSDSSISDTSPESVQRVMSPTSAEMAGSSAVSGGAQAQNTKKDLASSSRIDSRKGSSCSIFDELGFVPDEDFVSSEKIKTKGWYKDLSEYVGMKFVSSKYVISDFEDRLDSMRNENKNLTKEINDISQKAQSEIFDWKNKCKEASRETDDVKMNLSFRMLDIEQLEREIADLKEELEAA